MHLGGGNAFTIWRLATTSCATTTRHENSMVSLRAFFFFSCALCRRLGFYISAHVFLFLAELLIQKEPGNLQAQSLGTLIDKGLARGMYFLPGPPVMSPSGELTSTQRVTLAWRLLVVRPQ